jgi:hypothetical protein
MGRMSEARPAQLSAAAMSTAVLELAAIGR